MQIIPNELLAEIQAYCDCRTSLNFLLINSEDQTQRRRQLWTHQDSLGPLLELLPASLWTRAPNRGQHRCRHCKNLKKKTFNASTMTLDINAIRQVTMLAGVMSNLVIPSKERCPLIARIATDAMGFIHKEFGGPILCLRSISCWETNDDSRHGPCSASQEELLFQRVLTVCHLDTVECLDVPGVFPNTGDWVAKILEWTGSALKELRISDPPSSTQLWRNTERWTNLTTLIILEDSCNISVLYRHIAQLVSLQTFCININTHSSQDFGSTATIHWPALTKIEFCSPDGPLEEFLALFETPSLQVVKYKPSFGVDGTLMNAIFRASSVLVSIAVTIFDPESMFTPEDTLWSTLEPIDDEDVEPLFRLHTLRELRLDGIFTSEVTEEQIRKLRQQNPSDLLQFEALVGWQGIESDYEEYDT
ncbi:hypothetical protein CPB83DRAFT_840880 [Crepidotus variabilis]|uniref:Uncharacterized protein n=1 Tax=Crepidotus variabilis TaxID=179855 RepID=A0A9P6E3L9_9AGAR|nr:hypothetical protein CPB83DRAFT_840880 [Crepidotus variabilis]